MIAALDVHYRDDRAKAVLLLFESWGAAAPALVREQWFDTVAPYEPGAFYKRELPCLIPLLQQVQQGVLEAIIIDGYVFLSEDRPGLGAHLYEAIAGSVPVIGVAKTRFQGCERVAQPVLRGSSGNPLWVTAAGINTENAAAHIARMHGLDRLPALLRLLDRLTKQG